MPGDLSQDQLMWPTMLQQEEPVYILIVDNLGVHQTINMYTLGTHSILGDKQLAHPFNQDNLLTHTANMNELSRRWVTRRTNTLSLRCDQADREAEREADHGHWRHRVGSSSQCKICLIRICGRRRKLVVTWQHGPRPAPHEASHAAVWSLHWTLLQVKRRSQRMQQRRLLYMSLTAQTAAQKPNLHLMAWQFGCLFWQEILVRCTAVKHCKAGSIWAAETSKMDTLDIACQHMLRQPSHCNLCISRACSEKESTNAGDETSFI